MTTASGSRAVPSARPDVWRALARLPEYCEVCDVSYALVNPAETTVGLGTRFTCVRGRPPHAEPPADAVEGEIVAWEQDECFGTRLSSTSGTWHTRTELADVSGGTTRVTISIGWEAEAGGGLLRGVRRKRMQTLVDRTVESELAKLRDHLRAVEPGQGSPVEVVQQADGRVLHLRGEVDAQVVQRLELERRLTAEAVAAIDVTRLTYIDAIALPPLVRWARSAAQEGRRAVVRGASPAFDRTVDVMGVASAFVRTSDPA